LRIAEETLPDFVSDRKKGAPGHAAQRKENTKHICPQKKVFRQIGQRQKPKFIPSKQNLSKGKNTHRFLDHFPETFSTNEFSKKEILISA